MKCKHCKEPAGIKLKAYNLKLCDNCFVEFFKKRISAVIEKYKMFTPEEKILVAVSGGKDSLCVWSVLHELGFSVTGLFIDMGITDQSQKSKETVLSFAGEHDCALITVDIKDSFGTGVKEIARIARRVPCRICGLIRRYIMNAQGVHFDCIVTGHTLDDESALALGNILMWQNEYISRQHPVLQDNQSLRKKVKPLAFTYEEEILHYMRIKHINYFSEICPYSTNATSHLYKNIFSRLQERMPPVRLSFYKGYLKHKKEFSRERSDLVCCTRCGYLTVTELCNYCKLKEKVQNALAAEAERKERPVTSNREPDKAHSS